MCLTTRQLLGRSDRGYALFQMRYGSSWIIFFVTLAVTLLVTLWRRSLASMGPKNLERRTAMQVDGATPTVGTIPPRKRLKVLLATAAVVVIAAIGALL